MKKSLPIILLFIIHLNTSAQELEVAFAAGSGSVYLVEDLDNSVSTDYHAPIVFSGDLKYTPENAYFGLKLKYQDINAKLTGNNWWNQEDYLASIYFDGYIQNRSLLLLLEHVSSKASQFNFGYNFGLGFTKEKLSFDREGLQTAENEFSVIQAGAIIKYPLSTAVSLKIEPSLLWNDPVNSLYSDRYRMAGEDIHLLLQFGLTYRIK